MGAKDAAPLLRPSKEYTDKLVNIRKTHPPDSPDPIVVADASIWIVRALKTKDALGQYHLDPPVPVSAVWQYIHARCDILKKAGFCLILVFDGQRHPAKATETAKRYSEIPGKRLELRKIYSGEQAADLNRVKTLQAETACIRDDVLFEVLAFAKREDIPVVGAPFEADHQLIALCHQGVADYILTDDSDIPLLGAEKTIMRLSLAGKCCLVERDDILQTKFPALFETSAPLKLFDLALFSCLLGNDYVSRLANNGPDKSVCRMKKWVRFETDDDRTNFISEYVELLPDDDE